VTCCAFTGPAQMVCRKEELSNLCLRIKDELYFIMLQELWIFFSDTLKKAFAHAISLDTASAKI